MTRHVEPCMGTVFTIDIRDEGEWRAAIAEVVTWLHQVDAVFSIYRSDSDISRIRRREIGIADADPLVSEVLDRCLDMQRATDGFFTARRDGAFDPTGLVKGWAVERASRLLLERGSRHHAINGGGDIQAVGGTAPGAPWRVGISDPHDKRRVVATVSGIDLAVATSGTAERGSHITNPYTGQPAAGLASVTVVGPALTAADCYATAAFVMGTAAAAWLDAVPGYEAILVGTDGSAVRTRGCPVR
ncbi:MAG: FAD:protein FMN transferase [Frankiaceae bacterium]|nr:FAD:protein FMN transferase [Frankiaceae bacterium]MBV9869565.1 FAD:protein FMN transferase [Frankiaceae bacterium]